MSAVVDGSLEWVVGGGPSTRMTQSTSGEWRWIQSCSLVELYDRLCASCADDGVQPPSYTTMLRVWNEEWKHRLHMKPPSDHGKCNDCERFKRLRALAQSPEDHANVTAAYHCHLRRILQARRIDDFYVRCSEKSLRGDIPLASENNMLRTCMDAMDQAKLKLPRNISSAKEFTSMWRPQMILFGSIAFNLLEVFWVIDPDVVKNANLECTMMSRLLHLCHEYLVGKHMPRQWSMHVDNATAEGKNQIVAKYIAWQVWRRMWDSAELTEFTVGHTHNIQDQRFSECSSAVFREPCVQTPDHIMDIIREKVRPRSNRTLCVERLHAALDWRSLFDAVGVSMHGHTQTRKMKQSHVEACHVWRFSRREDVQWDGPIQSAWPDIVPHRNDIILLVKQYLDDESYNQDPVVFAPNENVASLGSGPSMQDARKSLSDRQLKEFKATAERISVRPWCLNPAFLLRVLCVFGFI